MLREKKDLKQFYPLNGYEGYEINKMGQIRRSDTKRILKGSVGGNGYLVCTLRSHGKTYTKRVHRLVAEQFIPNPDNKEVVNHIDENRANPCVTNLEWVTHQENLNHGTRNTRIGRKKLKPINEYTLEGRYIRTWKDISCIRDAIMEAYPDGDFIVESIKETKFPNSNDIKKSLARTIQSSIEHNNESELKRQFCGRIFEYYDGDTSDKNFVYGTRTQYIYKNLDIDFTNVKEEWLHQEKERSERLVELISTMSVSGLYDSKQIKLMEDALKALKYVEEHGILQAC